MAMQVYVDPVSWIRLYYNIYHKITEISKAQWSGLNCFIYIYVHVYFDIDIAMMICTYIYTHIYIYIYTSANPVH